MVAVALFLVVCAVSPKPMLADLFAIMFALPTGAVVPTFADMCNANGELAAENTVVSTPLSFVLIPAVIAIVGAP